MNAATGTYGAQSYLYDGTGNRTSRTVGSVTDTYAIDPASNRIATVTTGSNVRSFSYLPTGQASNDNRDPAHAYVYNYNNTGRLSSATLNGSTVGLNRVQMPKIPRPSRYWLLLLLLPIPGNPVYAGF